MTDVQKRPATDSGRALSVRKLVLSDFLNVTWRMATPVLIGAGLGLLLDTQFGTTPLLFISLMVIGFFAGVWMAIRLISRANSERSEP